jgi:hypothetical protein
MSRSIARLAAVLAFLTACGGGGDGSESTLPSGAARLSFAWTPWPTAGEPLSIDVLVLDEHGAVVDAAVDVTVTASTGSLGGTTTRRVTSGVARFTDLVFTRAGSTTLVASASGLEGDETATFTVAPGPAASLEFDAQPPATTTAGATLPDLRVAARDAWGNLAVNAWLDVTLSLDGAPFVGTRTRPLLSGLATFTGISVGSAGQDYAFSAAAGTLLPVASAVFDVLTGPAAGLEFVVHPRDAGAGDVIMPPVEVRVRDAWGNTVPEAREVTVSAATLSGTTTVLSVAGVATFADLSMTGAGTATLTASATDLAADTSATFQVAPGTAASLEFLSQPPTSVFAGAAMSASVEIVDTFGNRCDLTGGAVGLSLEGAELFGTTSRDLASGVASFPGLSVRTAGTGYRLAAQGAGLGPVESSAFNVHPASAHHLAFTAQPSTSIAGATLPAVAVSTLDTYGNVTGASGSVTVGFSAASSGFPTLYGTKTRPLVAGTATFDDLSVQKAGAGYRLAANGPVSPAASDAFDVLVGDATKLVFRVQPPASVSSGHPFPSPVEVAITDDWLNVVATGDRDVTLALEPSPAGGALAGAPIAAATAGIATFPALAVEGPGSGYRIRATAAGLEEAVSSAFDVAPHWHSIGPDGGDVTALAVDPAVATLAYAATNGCVWRSDPSGRWSRGCQGLSPMQIDALAVHPTVSEKVFAATSLGLYRSIDSGASWSVVSSLGAGTPYRTLAVAVAAAGAVYAGTFQNGLWRSDDGGTTWDALTAGLPPQRVTAIAIQPASSEVLYVAGVDASYVGTVYRSDDRGETWSETGFGPARFAGVKPAALLVDPSTPSRIYVGAQDGLYESQDGGATFVRVVWGTDVRDIAAHNATYQYRYAAGTSGMWRTVVGYEPWTATTGTGLPASPNAVAVAVRADGKVLLGTRYGVHSSTNGGTNWFGHSVGLRAFNVTAVGAGRRSGATIVYAATFGGGVYRSYDGGATWARGSHPAERQMFYAISVERGDANRAWLAGASGLYRTTNGGITWTEVLGAGTMYSTVLDPLDDAVVYAGGNSDVFRSTTGTTASFRDLNVCAGPAREMALSASAPLALWVGTDAGVCRVDLAGVEEMFVPYAWQAGTSGLVDAIAIDPDPTLAGSTVWASTSHGLHATVDGGATWTKTSGRFDALLAQHGKLFGARQLGTVEVSRDGGATFEPAGLGLYYGLVRAIADVPGVPDEIYVGTSWGGVFRTTSGGE